MCERHGVANIIRLRLSARRMLIHQDKLASYPLHYQGIAGGRTDEAGAYNAYLHREVS